MYDLTLAPRSELLAEWFPDGVPALWCPLVTHLTAEGKPDAERTARHLAYLAPHVGGLLVPGSTGEGWGMTDADARAQVETVLTAVEPHGMKVLIGVLKTDATEAADRIRDDLRWLQERTGASTPEEAMRRSGVVGFTVCGPSGKGLTQAELAAGVRQTLDVGVPVALYQLPQVTGNELAPETVQGLAEEYPNLLLFKDTSGRDVVATSSANLGGVFLVRGAEGEYARWTRPNGGPYSGFLLSTANVFPEPLARLAQGVGNPDELASLATQVQEVVETAFSLVADLPFGNAFANANKLLDHIMAHGPEAESQELPLLYGGDRLPASLLPPAIAALREAGLLPQHGYLKE